MRYGAATCEACVDVSDLLLVLGVVLLLPWAIFHIPGIDEQGTLQIYGVCLNLSSCYCESALNLSRSRLQKLFVPLSVRDVAPAGELIRHVGRFEESHMPYTRSLGHTERGTLPYEL